MCVCWQRSHSATSSDISKRTNISKHKTEVGNIYPELYLRESGLAQPLTAPHDELTQQLECFLSMRVSVSLSSRRLKKLSRWLDTCLASRNITAARPGPDTSRVYPKELRSEPSTSPPPLCSGYLLGSTRWEGYWPLGLWLLNLLWLPRRLRKWLFLDTLMTHLCHMCAWGSLVGPQHWHLYIFQPLHLIAWIPDVT